MTAAAMKELDFRRQIVGTKPPGLAVIFGWEHVGFRAAMTSQGWRTPGTGTMAKGWPDLVLARARDRRLIFAELKAENGRLSDDQERVLEVLRAMEFDASCGEVPIAHADDQRRECCPPWIQVFTWRPRDIDAIAEVLR